MFFPRVKSFAIRDVWSGVRSLAGMVSRNHVFAGPRSVGLAISDVCNTNCVMCGCHSPLLEPKGGAANRYMEPRIFESIVRESRAMGTFRVALCGGGEPALHPRCDDMLDLMARLGMQAYVITNGLALDDTRLRFWAALPAHYRFSIHAGDEQTWLRVHPGGRASQFQQLTRALKVLAASGVPQVSALHVIQKANFAEVSGMIEHARQVGVREVIFRPVQAWNTASAVVLSPEEESELRVGLRRCLQLARSYGIRTNIRQYMDDGLWIESGQMNTAPLYGRIPCYIGWLYADFDINGNMRPCLDSKRIIGRAGERPIRQMWNSPQYRAFRREARTMPRSRRLVAGCPCSRCCLANYNVNLHNLLRLRSFRYGKA